MLFNNPVVNNAITSVPQNTANMNNGSVTDPNKQKRLELITYVKAHFDLIAVTLLVAYLGYALYKIQKNKSK